MPISIAKSDMRIVVLSPSMSMGVALSNTLVKFNSITLSARHVSAVSALSASAAGSLVLYTVFAAALCEKAAASVKTDSAHCISSRTFQVSRHICRCS